MEAVLESARFFVKHDTNAETRAQAEALIASGNEAELRAAFTGRLEFGTAGLRGPMGPGSARMNDLSVIEAAQGLAVYILQVFGAEEAARRGVVLGFDHRARGSLNSRRFAQLTALAMLSRGIKVYLFSDLVCTPLVPFSIMRVGAVAGVMVTASHNPAADNGYKVYWANGSQIIPPHDKLISKAIDANLAPWADVAAAYASVTEEGVRAHPSGLVAPAADTAALVDAYIAAVAAQLCKHKADNADAAKTHVAMAYTAMHGVGYPFAIKAFAAFGLPAFVPTPEQVQPDPTFPTVAFPNPEEGKGALKLAMAAADRALCTVILANDPDADRLAVAEWQPSQDGSGAPLDPCVYRARQAGDKGEWRVFTGNEIGAILASWMWRCHVEGAGGKPPAPAVMLASTVSSKLLQAMAEVESAEAASKASSGDGTSTLPALSFQETLTGFKWMGNGIAHHQEGGTGLSPIFAFEEAIGFCSGTVVRDKDGVSAAAVLGEAAGVWAREGVSLSGQLQRMYARYGFHCTNNAYVFVDDPRKSDVVFARLRNEGHYWSRLAPAPGLPAGGLRIIAIRDLTGVGYDSEAPAPDHKPSLPTSSGSHMITYKFSNGVVATLRTSGTEPKLKWYSEIRGARGAAEADVRASLAATIDALVEQMLQPDANGLTRPHKE